MITASLSEVVSIGAVIPFLGVLASPENVFGLDKFQYFFQFFDITSPKGLLLPFTAIFCTAAVFSGFMRLLLLWAMNRVSFSAGADLSSKVYCSLLYQNYSFHLKNSSSSAITSVSSKVDAVIYQVIFQILTVLSSLLILCLIFIALLLINPLLTFLSFFGFGIIYGAIILLTKDRLRKNSYSIAKESTEAIKCLQEGIGAIRDIIIDNSQGIYSEIYKKADLNLRRSQGSNQFIGGSPKFAIEAIGLVLIACLAYFFSNSAEGVLGAIPILGAIALGAQRLLPVVQQLFNSWAIVNGAQSSLRDVVELLCLPMPLNEVSSNLNYEMGFNESVNLENVCFKYDSQGPEVLKGINLTILKGSKIGIVGPTGSGKSTLLDILMGLLGPTMGAIKVDGVEITNKNAHLWRSKIAHVPQSIYLSDRTILENIAFGVPKSEIDRDRVFVAAKMAQIADTIACLSEGYETTVGERGVRLSGGQKQRIGLARALYKNAKLIILDEATSALDSETESIVMKTIDALSKDLTIIIVAHRLSTLKNCEKIIHLKNGVINDISNFADLKLENY